MPSDRNNMYSVGQQPDGNVTLLSAGGGLSGWPEGLCLTSLTGGIGSEVEFAPCAASKNRENLWHLDEVSGLLHNRAIQVTHWTPLVCDVTARLPRSS